MIALLRSAAVTLAATALLAYGQAAPSPRPSPHQPVTFADAVAPLLYERCVSCHNPDGPAPFSLVSYAETRSRASLIAAATARRYMPPWKSAPGDGPFVGQHPLTDAEIDLIRRWVAEGALEGDVGRLPKPTWTKAWQLGSPDLILRLSEPYRLRADGGDVWRIFVFPVSLESVRYVRGLEFRPGDARVVHHARIRIDRSVASQQLDERDPDPGYEGLILKSAVYPDGHFLGWTPGQAGPLLPDDLAWRLEPGAHLVVEMHMVPTGKIEAVEPSIGLFFGQRPARRTPALLRLGRQDLDIPPGEPGYVSADSFALPVDATLLAVQPHAHSRAREIRATATLPDGTTRALLDIRDWDVRWQHLYQYVTPMRLPRGTTIAMRFTFDNSAQNPRNPQVPPARVLWGEEAMSEMGELWVQMLTDDERDLQALNAAIEPKMVGEDVVGYETRLRADPSKTQLHDQAGEAYLFLGQPAKAIPHFATALEARPESASAHYNLGIALADAERLGEASSHFRRALELKPDYAIAHNNLGSVLVRLGQPDEALDRFLDALRFDAANPDAHYNAGILWRARGELSQAVDHFRQAVTLRPDWTTAVANLAWLLSTSGDPTLLDPPEAIRLAERAADLSERRDPGILDVLAAAYASAGEFERALAILEAALALQPRDVVAAAIRQRQGLYRARKAYRSPASPPGQDGA